MVTIAAPFGHPNVSNETHRGHCSIDHYQQKDCSSHWAKSCADFAHLLWGCPIWIKKTALDCYSFFASRILQMDLPNVLRKCKRFHPVCSAAIVTSWPRFCTAAENLLHLLAYLRVIELWPALEFISTQDFSSSPMKVSKLKWLMLPLKFLVYEVAYLVIFTHLYAKMAMLAKWNSFANWHHSIFPFLEHSLLIGKFLFWKPKSYL